MINFGIVPLYKGVNDLQPWRNPTGAHAGLLFDKFANAWGPDPHALVAFDKGDRSRIERDKQDHHKEGYWLRQFPAQATFSRAMLAEFCCRQRQLAKCRGGMSLFLKNSSRFVTGMGREHPLENGFAWHHTLGVPYLPGSSLKGLLRAWLRETEGDIGTDKHGNGRYSENDDIRRWFGDPGQVGTVIMLDMLPLSPPNLVVDVMTPHYSPYYQDSEIPGDWHSPIPISYLAVEQNCSWQLGIVPAAGARKLSESGLNKLTRALLETMEISGAGAKTSVGYGRFVVDEQAREQIEREQAKRRDAREQAQRRAADQEAFIASLANDSEPLRTLKQLQRDQSWQNTAGDNNMMTALKRFAEDFPNPPQDCVAWIRELLESIPNYNGVWESPDEMKGKKKDKFKYSAQGIRELVKRLNPRLRRPDTP